MVRFISIIDAWGLLLRIRSPNNLTIASGKSLYASWLEQEAPPTRAG